MSRSAHVVWLSFSSLLLAGCPKPTFTHVPSYEEARAAAAKEGPRIPDPIEERYKLKCGDKPVAVAANPPGVPYTGVLFTNDRAECIKAQLTERDRLRTELDAERLSARTKQIINDAAMKRIVEESKRSWWDNYGGGVLFAVGSAVGMAVVIGIVYALSKGKSITSNPVVLPPVR